LTNNLEDAGVKKVLKKIAENAIHVETTLYNPEHLQKKIS